MAGKGVEYTAEMQEMLVKEWIKSGEAATSWCGADDNRPHYNTFKNWPAVIAHRATTGRGYKRSTPAKPQGIRVSSKPLVDDIDSQFEEWYAQECEAKKAAAYDRWLSENQEAIEQRALEKVRAELASKRAKMAVKPADVGEDL
ncbi:hypothetical protein FIV41_25805 [Pseudomonas marginalis]|uniref:POU-specific domain-containing protein n=1 Tax=Pseudomonas marginalis TaxID=298 RepID=A0A9X9FVL5_PSEMA|nr:hypothetical protein [Pseudomonas marginalis]TWR52506.1 hypothetical protein FIV41_25805 [Pseudomonas marginalis]SEC53951.1 hypothetical protein SAMN04490193_2994 [Pseudomonas marginalis]